MSTGIKHFFKGIDTSSLVPLAAFTTIVGFVFCPLVRLSDTASIPLSMLASSFCVFVIGCYVSEIFKSKISRKGLKCLIIAAILFCLHIFIDDAITTWRYSPTVSVLWYPWSYVELVRVNPFFLFLGMIGNYSSDSMLDKPYIFRRYGSIKRDIFIALISFIAFVVMMYMTCIPALFEGLALKASWIVRFFVRMVCFIPWVMLIVSLYRCLTSKWAYKVTERTPKILTFIAYLAPIAIWYVWNIHFPVNNIFELLSFIILVLSFIIYVRLVCRLIQGIVRRITEKESMHQGPNGQNL